MVAVFQKVLESGRNKKGLITPEQVRKWYRNEAGKIRQFTTGGIIRDGARENRENVKDKMTVDSIGRLFLYQYDPKTKETLPYYDIFPLVFPFALDKDGFKGLNMHYLPPPLRAKLMDAFHEITNNNRYDKTTKLKLSYELLKTSANMKYFKPCVKKYLYSHMVTKFLMIPADQWDIALHVPLQSFRKASSRTVYRDSRRIISGG